MLQVKCPFLKHLILADSSSRMPTRINRNKWPSQLDSCIIVSAILIPICEISSITLIKHVQDTGEAYSRER